MALHIAQLHSYVDFECYSLKGLGEVYQDLLQNQVAGDFLKRAGALADAVGERFTAVEAFLSLAETYIQMDYTHHAQSNLDGAHEVLVITECPYTGLKMQFYICVASLAVKRGELKQARGGQWRVKAFTVWR